MNNRIYSMFDAFNRTIYTAFQVREISYLTSDTNNKSLTFMDLYTVSLVKVFTYNTQQKRIFPRAPN